MSTHGYGREDIHSVFVDLVGVHENTNDIRRALQALLPHADVHVTHALARMHRIRILFSTGRKDPIRGSVLEHDEISRFDGRCTMIWLHDKDRNTSASIFEMVVTLAELRDWILALPDVAALAQEGA